MSSATSTKEISLKFHADHVGDLDNQENFEPSSYQVVAELNGDSDRQQKNFLI